VWSKDIEVALRTARGIRAGTVVVNGYSEGDIGTPFGGYKLSGFGGRDNGLGDTPLEISDRFVSHLLRQPEVGAVAADLPDARLLALARQQSVRRRQAASYCRHRSHPVGIRHCPIPSSLIVVWLA
jgi:Aldehyde dehydrogenase family